MSEYAPYQQRVIIEKQELDEKIVRLNEFLGSPIFDNLPIDEQARMMEQAGVMEHYSDILGRRIGAF